ncbi:putative protein kinase [Leptomonas pyrrhocoris]|uniref:Protein kinase domain-containing protein n=1 Tax=Leptomonas pyrrhocoris TaxID=157538 RepID=A0A0M9G361_LEPPY|nr:putative protein kinase [Leptomonas pyrrhocoris]KPA81219.1 putative protein kinase [Leptomonas pyrrhocoris]|eukprot:XP_015659658.1 putative protein kinase [Leptomonas pyrrhocoris]
MFPYRGVLVDIATGEAGLPPNLSTPPPTASSSGRGAASKKDSALPAKLWRAALAELHVFDECPKTAPGPSTTGSTAASRLSSSTATNAAGAPQRKKMSASTIVVKKRPPQRIVEAEAAAAAAAQAAQEAIASAPQQPALDVPLEQPFAEGKNTTEGKRLFSVVTNSQVPAVLARLKALLEDFCAAIEQCRVALEEQRSGQMSTWEIAKPEDDGREVSANEDASISYPSLRRRSPGSRQRDNHTVFVADVPLRNQSAQVMSETASPNSMMEVLRGDHGSGSSNCYLPLTDRSISGESPRDVAEQSVCGLEAADLPKGIVALAYIIAEYLLALFHPTATFVELEEEAAVLGSQARNDDPTQLSASSLARGAHPGAAGEGKRSTSPLPRTAYSTTPLTRPRSGGRASIRVAEVSEELSELKAAAHGYIWDRITTLVRSISLNSTSISSDVSVTAAAASGTAEIKENGKVAATEEERRAQAYVQLPFLIWLYAASGLATDAARGHEEAAAKIGTGTATPPLTLAELLPTVDTLARQLLRRQYERVQPTAETLLTANAFLASTGVRMTDKAIVERLFPLQSGTAVNDVLAFTTLQSTASLLGHDGGDLVDVSTATNSTLNPVATLASTTTASEALLSTEEALLGSNRGATVSESSMARGESGTKVGRSPLRRLRGALQSSTASPPSGGGTRLGHCSSADVSTVEMYLRWLRGRKDSVEREADKRSGGATPSKVKERDTCTSKELTSAHTRGCDREVGEGEGERDGGEKSGADLTVVSSPTSSNSIRGPGAASCVTQRQQEEVFHLSSMMPAADLSPCVARVELELHQARGALQFARKLGTLYATQDMNTLLPLLPTLEKEKGKLPLLEPPLSARMEAGSVILRSSFDSCAVSGSPNTFVGNSSLSVPTGYRALPPSMTSPLTVANSTLLPGRLPPLIVAPLPPSERPSGGIPAMLTSRRMATSASTATLFPSILPPSMEWESLMAHLNISAAAMASLSDQFFVSSARALEVAFSMAMVLLSHVMGEALLKGERAASEPSNAIIAEKSKKGKSSMAPVKKPLSVISASSAAAAMSKVAEPSGVTLTTAAGPLADVRRPRPLSFDLAKVFGFGKRYRRYQHYSLLVRDTLVNAALSALQQKDVIITQELLQYIALETAISHHYAQVQEQQLPASVAPPIKPNGWSHKSDSATAASASAHRTRKGTKAPARHVGQWMASLLDNSTSFVNVWFSSFAHLVDTTKHLLKGDHNTPSSLKDAVWHLAGLAQYFLLTRARGYDVYGKRNHLSAASQPVYMDDLSAMFSLFSGNRSGTLRDSSVAASDLVASPALQHYITSQILEPAEKVLGVIVSFMESIAEALTADMDSGAATERQQREGVMFAETISEDDNAAVGLAPEASDYMGSACDSLSQLSSDAGGGGGGVGGGWNSAANRSEAQEAPTCWMELAVHYFLEIVDVLLDVSLYLPEKPLIIYQLTVGASRMPAFASDFLDVMMTVGFAGLRSPSMSATDFHQSTTTAEEGESTGDSALERLQGFLSRYTSLVLQSAVTGFTAEGLSTPAWMAAAQGSPTNASTTTGHGEEAAPRRFMTTLLASVAASLAPVGLEEIALSSVLPVAGQQSQQQPLPTSRSTGASASAMVETSSSPAGLSSSTRSTMWWPRARFQRYPHLVRILEHAQLLCLYLNTSHGDESTPLAPILALMEHEGDATGRDSSQRLRVSAVTTLLNTSTGPCAQLLSVPYACPPLTIEASSYVASSVPNTSRERPMFHSPIEQPQGRYYSAVTGSASHRLVLSDRVLREVCGGLWIRVEVLQLLRFAAAPLDTDSFESFTKMAGELSRRVREKSMQSHYKAVASMKARAESVLPKSYASTYVRLLFLRYVQAFYADMQAVGATGHAAGGHPANGARASASTSQDHAPPERTETSANTSALHTNSNSYRAHWALHIDPNNGETMMRSVPSPRTNAFLTSPLQNLSRRLWTQYCYQLLGALRDLCWNSTEAHETANNLSIASVYGRLLQMIGGRPNKEEYEDEHDEEEGSEGEDSLLDEPDFHLDETNVATIITFDRSLAPYGTIKDGKPKGFADFESASSGSEGTRTPTTLASPPPFALQTRKPGSLSKASRRDGRATMTTLYSKRSTPPPSTGSPNNGPIQISVNMSDLTTLQSLELKHRNEMNSLHGDSTGDNGASAPVNSPPVTAAVSPPPLLPQLALTGLKPPLYFASSGDTAAAQEDAYFKEQSKPRQAAEGEEERQGCVTSGSVMEANSYMFEADEGKNGFEEGELEDFELSSVSPKSSPQNMSLTGEQPDRSQARRRSRPDVSSIFSQGDAAASLGNTPKPPGLTIPKLALGNLGPPLYFTSAGDTGVFAEVTATGSPALPSVVAVPALNFNSPDAAAMGGGSPPLAKHVDPARRPAQGSTTNEPPTEKATAASFSPPPPPPVSPSVTTKTVGCLALPKLSFEALGPPMYFTSSGDTGGFVEAQDVTNSTPSLPTVERVATTVATTFSRNGSQASTNTACFRSSTAAQRAPPVASPTEVGGTPAAAASRYRDFSSSDAADAASSSLTSSFGARAATRKDKGGVNDDTDSRAALGSQPDSDSSLVLSAVSGIEAARQACGRKKVTRRSPRLSVTPVVPPVVTMELILSLCSIILQRDSGMIQYGYTVSSLTQKRVLPGMSASQRRWINSGSNVAASNVPGAFPSTAFFTDRGMAASQADRWRYTPQHSPSSFHVIQALHNYLKDARNTFVVDLLEEWMLDEYAAMERARMEHFEAEYQPLQRGGCTRTLSFSSTCRSGANTTTTDAVNRYNSALSMGRFVLLRLLLPRAVTQLVIPPNERRIGSGGYGSVTSGTVQAISNAAAALPTRWGRRGRHWRPSPDTNTNSGTARSASGSAGFGSKSPSSPGRAMSGALENLRTPWRVAVYRTAQAVCRCDVAIKHLSLSAQGSESGNLPVCHAEVLTMYRLRGHPNIVPLLSFDNTKDEYVLIMPNYTSGSFRVWRQKHYQLGCAVLSLSSEPNELHKGGSLLLRPLSSPASSCSLFATCARTLLQVLDAVVFMHEHHIRHGDIKCDNVLIDRTDVDVETKLDPPCLPLSVRLCDFGSCDTCDDDDIRSLKNDIMAGAARFMAGRWGVGRGTEAIQPPEVMSAKRRYTLFHRIMTTTTTTTSAGAAKAAAPLPVVLERTDRGPFGASMLATSFDHLPRRGAAESVEGEERALTERLRRAELSADVWACGCLLYEMLTGRMLFGEARLGRLLVLAAADDDAGQEQGSGWRPTGSTVPRAASKATTSTADGASQARQAAPLSAPSSMRQALDEWERHDLENAVGTQVVDFMSCLLDLDPLQRPSAAEALWRWKEILINMGFDV